MMGPHVAAGGGGLGQEQMRLIHDDQHHVDDGEHQSRGPMCSHPFPYGATTPTLEACGWACILYDRLCFKRLHMCPQRAEGRR